MILIRKSCRLDNGIHLHDITAGVDTRLGDGVSKENDLLGFNGKGCGQHGCHDQQEWYKLSGSHIVRLNEYMESGGKKYTGQ